MWKWWCLWPLTEPGSRPLLRQQWVFAGAGEEERSVRSESERRTSVRGKPPLHWAHRQSCLDCVPQRGQPEPRVSPVLTGCVRSSGEEAQTEPPQPEQLPPEDWWALRTQTQHWQDSQTDPQRPYTTAPQSNPLCLLNISVRLTQALKDRQRWWTFSLHPGFWCSAWSQE